ncbi:MAG: SIR2 family protein [Telluria sp.]|nr:SIR2 family protein [Telluria sp.]
MIDPIHSLSFSIQANRGVYAVLFGSGISRSAKIPTGWEITLDLVRKLAVVAGEDCGVAPDEWYRTKYEREPDYSELLDAVAKTPAERQQLLRMYWEPTETEREEGAKQPTAAHRAIAQLVAKGFIKVIVTTNFDRLMETALAEVGVVPTVLSTPDQVHGSLPLIHTQCCLFKVHGDYLDTRILNTPEELSAYPTEFDSLLDRIFDEFGLIVCGWSADWDEALRRAMTRAPSRRFATYWAARGVPSASAQRLIDHRGAQSVAITDADSFFAAVQQQVESLEEFARPHPLSTEAAVASLKRYMSEPKYRIQHSDLIANEVQRVAHAVRADNFSLGAPVPDTASVTSRVNAYEGICEMLIHMGVHAGLWAESEHFQAWQRALTLLCQSAPVNGGTYDAWNGFQKYPATLLFYAIGLGAIDSGRLSLLRAVFETSIVREYKKDQLVIQLLPPFCMFEHAQSPKLLDGMSDRRAPLNDRLHDKLRPLLRRIIPSDSAYTLAFDKLELLMALGFGNRSDRSPEWYWVPVGAFSYRRDNQNRLLKEIEDSISGAGNESPYVVSRLFGTTAVECGKIIANFKTFMTKVPWY